MGKGPTVSVGRENHPGVVERLRSVARRKRIKLQTETFSFRGGTDALAFWTKHGGIPTALLGVPLRYMHSTVEMLDLRDLEALAKLLSGFCQDLKKGETFRVKV
jgi:endoglucanase